MKNKFTGHRDYPEIIQYHPYSGSSKEPENQKFVKRKGRRVLFDQVMVIDGATGSELDRKGVDCCLPFWSAGAIYHSPDVLLEVHKEYLINGAQAITTNTFNTSTRKLDRDGMGYMSKKLTKKAVKIAIKARD